MSSSVAQGRAADCRAGLRVSNLEVVYHTAVLVLKGVSLEVPQGSIVALLGPNGAGKTTTLRAITGLLDIHDGRITKGSVTWDGDALTGRSPDGIVRHGVGHVMEGRRIFAELTVEENLVAGAWGLSRSGLLESLERSYDRFAILRERRRQPAGFLSGGEQQMLAVARALMSQPRLLLLDEPSLGLSPRVAGEVAELIARVGTTGVTVLLVEQNASLALDLAEYAYVLENGKVVIDGPSSRLRDDRDMQEFYLAAGHGATDTYRHAKRYRRRRRWLS